jgi:hypothetical protein
MRHVFGWHLPPGCTDRHIDDAISGGEPDPPCCASCKWFADDDDGDGHGACTLLLNNPAERGWRVRPDHWCREWEAPGPPCD